MVSTHGHVHHHSPAPFALAPCAHIPPETDFTLNYVFALAGRNSHGGWAGGVRCAPTGTPTDAHTIHYHPPAPLHASSCTQCSKGVSSFTGENVAHGPWVPLPCL